MKSKISIIIISLVLTMAATMALVSAGNAAGPASRTTSAAPEHAQVPMGVTVNSTAPLTPVGSGFTYQGSLKSGGNPANGQYDFQFTLYDAPTGGAVVGGPVTAANVTVANGLFTVTLDFNTSPFTGDARYLEIAVRQTGGGTYTTLAPRQPLTPAPYALSLKPGAVISGTTGTILTATYNGSSPYGMGLFGDSTTGYGVYGHSTSGGGVFGGSNNSTGVYGISNSYEGVEGNTASNYAGVYGHNTGSGGIGPGVRGDGDTGPGVYGLSANNKGVWGVSTTNDGVHGVSTSLSGVAGISSSGNGVYGTSTTGWAGYFDGNVNVTGTCCAASEGTYRIDDPLDPANKYLNQSAVESPDMKTIYDGIAVLDAAGEAWVEMPSYSQSLNQDFRYQLTPIGAPGRDLYIAQEIQNNRFKIAGGKASMKVSWQVTGIRHDPYAQQHPVAVEQNKPASEQGKYLHPNVYGQPDSMGINYEQLQSAKQTLPPATTGR